MKRLISIFMASITVVSVVSASFTAIAQEIEENNAILVSEKVSAMCEKYDTENEADELTEETETTQRTVEERLIVKTNSRINTYKSVESVYGLGYAFIQFENDEDANAAFETYQKQGYTVQYDSILSLDEMNSDASSSQTNDNWAYDILEIPETLAYFASSGKDYADITVGILDTGLDHTHELFAGRITRTDLNFSTNSNENDCMDDYGHGTSVAGIVAISTPDNVKIEPYKIGGSDGKVYSSNLICCLEYILNMADPPDVLNMSFSIRDYKNEIDTTLFEDLVNAGITVSVSAGNDTSEVEYIKPASIESMITVSASDENNNRCKWSNFGDLVDIATPGNTTIYTAEMGAGYCEDFGGTSAASPFVAAAAATVLMQNEELSPAEVESKIKETAVPIHKRSYFTWCGAGLVNFYGLIDQPKLGDVAFSYTGGDYYEPIAVELSCSDPNAKIIYTTDMTVPSLTNGTVYTEPIEVTEHSRILTVAYDENNKLKSDYTFSEYRVIYEADENDFEITDQGSIMAYNGEHKAIIIPDTINRITPIEIGRQCFYQDDIEYVDLPDCITLIQNEAFRESSLEFISGYGVEYCNQSAFYGCINLYQENMPNIDGVSKYAFYDCMLLTDFTFKDKLLDAGDSAFCYTSLLEADFPNLETQKTVFESTPCYTAYLPKLTELRGGFQNCSNLESIYIPNVTEISLSAFDGCESLSEDAVPFEQFTKIGTNGLSGAHFENIILPNCKEIGDGSFVGASSKYISAPKVTTVGEDAFRYTFNLEEVNLESEETFAGTKAEFCDSVKLKYLYLPNAKNIPLFEWQMSLEVLQNGSWETQLEFIYAPKATEFQQSEESDLYYCKNLKFIFAPNLESLSLSMVLEDEDVAHYGVRFPKDSNVKLYLSDKLTTYNDYKTSVAQLTIVAPESSYAHTVATENGYEFISSDNIAEALGGQIRTRDSGLRFGFTLDSSNIGFDYELLADDVEYGFVYTFDELSGEKDNINAQLKAGNEGTYTIEAAKRNVEGTVSQYNAVFTGIPASHYDSKTSARAYVCIDGMYFYSPVTTRSFNDVANAIVNDGTMEQTIRDEVYNLISREM